jgi:cell division protein FtsL
MSATRRIEIGIALLLACGVVASGIWLASTKHESRRLFVELEELKREQDRLQIDWGRLQLEQSTWATHSRIESLAREELGLREPDPEEILVVVGPDQ